MPNVTYAHSCTTCGVYLVDAVGLVPDSEILWLVDDVVGGAAVGVPQWTSSIGVGSSSSDLLFAGEVTVKPLIALYDGVAKATIQMTLAAISSIVVVAPFLATSWSWSATFPPRPKPPRPPRAAAFTEE